MAVIQNITIHPSHVSPILGEFAAAILPHIPEYDDTRNWEVVAQAACETHGGTVLLTITAAEALCAMRAINAAVELSAMTPAANEVALYVLDRLPEVMAGTAYDETTMTKADTLARMDWTIEEVQENASKTVFPGTIEAMRRVRWAINLLVPEGAVFSHRLPRGYREGPTVGEVEAVEKAFAKVGLSVDQAHEAVGLHPKTEAAE